MAAITLRVKGLEPLRRKLRTDIRQAVAREILKALQHGALLIEGDAKRTAPVETGRLRASITHQPLTLGDHTIGFAVGTDVDYAAFVEFGTGRRGATSQLTQSAREALHQGGYAHGPSAGMVAQPFLFPAFEKRRRQIPDLVADAIRKATETAA